MNAMSLFFGKEKIIIMSGVASTVETLAVNQHSSISNNDVLRIENPFVKKYDQQLREYLGEEDYLQFEAAKKINDDNWKSFFVQGLIRHEVIYENIQIPEFNENFDVEIGFKEILSENTHPSAIFMYPEYVRMVLSLPSELQNLVN
jgi:hypothetical protein